MSLSRAQTLLYNGLTLYCLWSVLGLIILTTFNCVSEINLFETQNIVNDKFTESNAQKTNKSYQNREIRTESADISRISVEI